MKLKAVKLVGYKGIFNGMGLTSITIDLSKSFNKVVIIKGDNGSGKSTLFNALHMFPDGNEQLMDNMECRKELLYEDRGTEYRIKIIHPWTNKRGTSKSYITKIENGYKVELNPNGNYGSYMEIIQEEFMIDKNYFSLSQLSVENRGLVDMTPSVRKRFISSIMKDVEIFNDINKSVSQIARTYKTNIQSITDKIKKLDGVGSLDKKYEETTSKLNDVTKDLEDVKIRIGINSNKVKELDGDGTILTRIDEFFEKRNKIKVELNTLNSNIKSKQKLIGLEINREGINTLLKKVKKDKESLGNELTDTSLYIKELLMEQEKINSEIQDKQIYMMSLQSDENYDEYIKELNNIRERLKELNPLIKELKVNNIRAITSSEYSRALQYLEDIKNLNQIFCSQTYESDRINVLGGLSSGTIQDVSYYNDEIKRMNHTIEGIADEISKLKRNREQLEELGERPKNCNIDNCHYLKNIINVSIKDINVVNKKINDAYIKLDKCDKTIEWCNSTIDILGYYNRYTQLIKDAKLFIDKLSISIFNSDKEIIDSVLSNYDFSEFDSLQAMKEVSNIVDEYNNLMITHDKYIIYEENYNRMMSVLKEIEDSVNKLNVDADEVYKTLEETKTKKEELSSQLVKHSELETVLEELVELYNEFDVIQSNYDEVNKEYERLTDSNQSLSDLNTQIMKDKVILDGLEDFKTRLTESLNNIQYMMRTSVEYKKELKDLNVLYERIDIIKKASSPSTGIQTVFMSMYMNKILETANNLLKYLFNGEFRLEDFVINSTEFKIPCQGEGILNEDVSSMSTSQKCMISLVVSFSLLCQTSSKYNILKLDEMDGGLDNTNRGIFVDTLYRLMDLLESEQVFIISHNNEMNMNECDLIVLRSSDTFHNGNILYNYNA